MKEDVKITLFFNYLEELTRKYNEVFELKEKLLKELQERAMYDYLTGLYNRHVLIELLEKEIERVKREGEERVFVVFLDLDNFKKVNDIYGHEKGDEVLKEVAKILRESFRKYDIVSRFGGDEFVALVPTKERDKDQLLARLVEIERRIEETFSDFGISISYGIAVAPDEGVNVSELINLSDKRMYMMKEKKKKRK
ncbi:MAG: GGDEF domain-containing protein [Desulfurobacteriaceae bacterium]